MLVWSFQLPQLLTQIFNEIEQVSWVRHRDVHILTVGRYAYASDQRFSIVRARPSEDWTLQIKYSQARDAGLYECQVSTQPHRSQFIQLNVVGKSLLFHRLFLPFIAYFLMKIVTVRCLDYVALCFSFMYRFQFCQSAPVYLFFSVYELH